MRLHSTWNSFETPSPRLFPNTAKTATVPTTVVVFKSDESYRPFKPLVAGKPMNVSGYFQPSEDMNYISLTAGTPIPREVYHQYAHQLMSDIPVTLPLWFSEGVAEFYSTFEISAKDKKYHGWPGHSGVRRCFPHGPSCSHSTTCSSGIEARNSTTKPAARGSITRSPGLWPITSLQGPTAIASEQMTQFLDLLAKDKSLPESFQKAFETDYGAMQHELENYIRDRRVWPSLEAPLKEKSEVDKDSKVRILSEAESEFYSGDLLLHISRLLEAETHLKQAIALDSGHEFGHRRSGNGSVPSR